MLAAVAARALGLDCRCVCVRHGLTSGPHGDATALFLRVAFRLADLRLVDFDARIVAGFTTGTPAFRWALLGTRRLVATVLDAFVVANLLNSRHFVLATGKTVGAIAGILARRQAVVVAGTPFLAERLAAFAGLGDARVVAVVFAVAALAVAALVDPRCFA